MWPLSIVNETIWNNPRPWWRHQMETFSALLALCEGNPPATGVIPLQRPATRSFNVVFMCAWTNCWTSNREAGDLRHHCAHYNITVMGDYESKSTHCASNIWWEWTYETEWYVTRLTCLGVQIVGQVVLESYFCSLLRSIDAHNKVSKCVKSCHQRV